MFIAWLPHQQLTDCLSPVIAIKTGLKRGDEHHSNAHKSF